MADSFFGNIMERAQRMRDAKLAYMEALTAQAQEGVQRKAFLDRPASVYPEYMDMFYETFPGVGEKESQARMTLPTMDRTGATGETQTLQPGGAPFRSIGDITGALSLASKLKPINQLSWQMGKDEEKKADMGDVLDDLRLRDERIASIMGDIPGKKFAAAYPPLAQKIIERFAVPEHTDETKEYIFSKSPEGRGFLDYVGKRKSLERGPQDVATWETPGGEIINLAKGVMPPAGSNPFSGTARDVETWMLPDGSTTNLKKGTMPPPGAIPFKSSPEALKEFKGYKNLSPEERALYGEFKAAGQKEGGEYGTPYLDEAGNLLQKELKTGKVTKVASPPQGWTIEGDGQGGFKMVQGPQKPGGAVSPATKSALEKDVVSLTDQLQALQPTLENYSKEFLTWYGRGKVWALNKASQAGFDLGPEGTAYVGAARSMTEGLEYVFNLYRKNITGAQAVMKELSMLRESILNKELSPAQFKYSVGRFIDLGTKAIKLRLTLMSKGINEETINDELNGLLKKEGAPGQKVRGKIEKENPYDKFWKPKGE